MRPMLGPLLRVQGLLETYNMNPQALKVISCFPDKVTMIWSLIKKTRFPDYRNLILFLLNSNQNYRGH